jgi:hypothetical protein
MRELLRAWRERLMLSSLRAAARQQGLAPLMGKLETALPDIKRQYTSFDVDSEYLRVKVRAQHSFQIALAGPEIESRPKAVIVDIGDSSGAHISYLKALHPNGGHRYLSVNLDPTAVEKVKERGIEAVLARAEELDKHGITADVFLLFETMEHFSDPVTFLHELSSKTKCQRLVLTVPYVCKTRMGLHHVRAGLRKPLAAESVHIWELSPEDLRLLFKHSGWKLEREWIYRQYPRFHPLALTRWIWRRWDFEGFYGAVLSRDDSWSSLYQSWR